MTLRTAGLIAGVLGVILLAVGLIADAVKPASEATPKAQVDADVLVVPPQMLAIAPDAVFTISSDGHLAAHSARTEDVDAWTASRTSVTITGVDTWDALSVTTDEPAPSPSPSVDPSASTSPSPSSSPSASPSPSASASAAPSATPSPSAAPQPEGSQDIWRETAQHEGDYTIAASDVPVGLTLVVESIDGQGINAASLTMSRTIDDAWIGQVTWWGVALCIVGLIALIALFIDVRPAQTKGEQWLAERSAIGSGKEDPKPGSRRARRSVGAAMPVAIIPEEAPTTGSVPVVDSAPAEVMVAVSGSIPTVSAQADAFEPPDRADSEQPADEAREEDEERP